MEASGISPEEQEVDRQIQQAELGVQRLYRTSLEEIVVGLMPKRNDDPEKVADALIELKVFEKTANCPDPRRIALAAAKRIMEKHPLP